MSAPSQRGYLREPPKGNVSGKGNRSQSIMRFPFGKSVMKLLRTVISACLQDNIQRMSAALAYYTIFSLAPLLIISIAIAGLLLGTDAAQGAIVAEIQQLIGSEGARAIQAIIVSANKPAIGTVTGAAGVILLVIGATGAFSEVYDALNNIWRAKAPTKSGALAILRARFLSFGLVLIVGFLMLVSLLISAALSAISKYAEHILPSPPLIFHALDLIVTTTVIAVLFAMIFRILPETEIKWSDVWVGSIATAILFIAGKLVIGIYIGKTISASSYGAASSLVVVIAWIYYSALILYFGAELTRAYAQNYGSHMEPSSGF
jgi:membrane protein